MRTRIFHTKFWEDDYILSLTTKEKCLFNFYITNSAIGLTGVYEISPKLVCLFTGLSPKEVEEINENFSKDGKIFFYKNWVKVVNSSKYQTFSGEKNEKAKDSELKAIPEAVLESMDTLSIGYQDLSTTGDSPNNHKSIISNSNKGVVKGKTVNDITDEDLEEISTAYKVPVSFVKLQFEQLKNYVQSSPKRSVYKDYKAALRNWVLRDAQKMARIQTRGGYIDATNV